MTSIKKRIRQFTLLALLSGFLIILSIIVANKVVVDNTKNRLFHDLDEVSYNRVGLLLGTVKYLRSGGVNQYYSNRIDATVALFNFGKIDYILISGDNCRRGYDEPTSMKEDLLARGIPEERLTLDYAGFRTLDSVVRCKHIFGQDKVTIISQQFHNERALYIADYKGIEAVAFNAVGVSMSYGFRVILREYLARVKMMLDLLFNVQPKFMGQKVMIAEPAFQIHD